MSTLTNFIDVPEDMQIIEDLFNDYSLEDICEKTHISQTRWLELKNEEDLPNRDELEGIYNFSYVRGLPFAEIRYQSAVDQFQSENVKVCTHGSRGNLKGEIRLDMSAGSNDFGSGFYMGEKIEQAGMWVAEEPQASLYLFLFDKTGLKEARFDLNSEWFIAVSIFRDKLPEKYLDSPVAKRVIDKVNSADYVYAPIADNNLFEIIDDFADGNLTDQQAAYSMATTQLGYQYVLKKDECLNHLDLIDHLYMCNYDKAKYIDRNTAEMSTSSFKSRIAKSKFSNKGMYIDELMRSE